MTITNTFIHFQNVERALLPPLRTQGKGKSTEPGVGDERDAHYDPSQYVALGLIFLIWKMVSKIFLMIPRRLISLFLLLAEKYNVKE